MGKVPATLGSPPLSVKEGWVQPSSAIQEKGMLATGHIQEKGMLATGHIQEKGMLATAHSEGALATVRSAHSDETGGIRNPGIGGVPAPQRGISG